MLNLLFSIKDVRSGWGPVYPMKTKGEAERQFINTINSEQSGNLYLHPEDFDLFCLGEYDTITGDVKNYDQKEKVIAGFSCAEMRKQ